MKATPNTLTHSWRFFLISIVGLVVDIGIAWVLIASFGASDWVGASVGFFIATATNYIGHQLWTFREHSQGLSWRRFFLFTSVVMATLAVRLGVLSLAGSVLMGDGWKIPGRLLFAAAISFVVTFFLSRQFVFHKQA